MAEPCLKCNESISTEAMRCPECGYEPRNRGKWGRVIGVLVGFVLTMTGIGAIIGLPMLWYLYKAQQRAKERLPTVDEPEHI